jgi:hypothetical protein
MQTLPKLLGLVLSITLVPSLVVAQRQQKKEDAFLHESPRIGDRIPDLVVYDSAGNEVKTSSLQGHYTVLTFGCLT